MQHVFVRKKLFSSKNTKKWPKWANFRHQSPVQTPCTDNNVRSNDRHGSYYSSMESPWKKENFHILYIFLGQKLEILEQLLRAGHERGRRGAPGKAGTVHRKSHNMISWWIFNENQSFYTQKKGFFKPVSAEKVSLAADKRFGRYKAKRSIWRQS